MAAKVFASAVAGLGIAGDFESSVGHEQVCVLPERRQAAAIGRNEVQALERDCAIASLGGRLVRSVCVASVRGASLPVALVRSKPRNYVRQRRLELAPHNRFDAELAQIRFVDWSIQTIKAEMGARIQASHRFDQGRMARRVAVCMGT